jgi:hypothetical protein
MVGVEKLCLVQMRRILCCRYRLLTRVTDDSAIIKHAGGARESDPGGYSSNAAGEIQLT